MENYCESCEHDEDIGFCNKCFYNHILEQRGIPPTEYEARPKPQTNADKIRAMTDKELAEFMALNTDCYYCRAKDSDRCASLATTPCGDIWLNWLRQEADT